MASSSSPPNAYTSLDAARASRSGAFITAWPADEPYFAPSIEQLVRDMTRKSKSRSKSKGQAGATRNSSTESLAHRPCKTSTAGK
ncbi:hypothetical protein E4U21_000538 [Claviceps maximensis]|nr:hypothetical protein E4U21_000538 [Claviceps maximensis]